MALLSVAAFQYSIYSVKRRFTDIWKQYGGLWKLAIRQAIHIRTIPNEVIEDLGYLSTLSARESQRKGSQELLERETPTRSQLEQLRAVLFA